MWFMYLLSWVATIFQICFITLSIAAGLYYLAEIVEEYTVLTSKIIKYLIWATFVVLVGLLLFEELPLLLLAACFLTNFIYLMVLKTFPFIEFTSPTFILSIVLIVADHYLAFSYFSSVWHPFSEVLGFFTIVLWMVPFALFVSLSANENVLPTLSEIPSSRPAGAEDEGDVVSNYFRKKSKRFGLLSIFKYAQDSILPEKVKKGY